MIVIRSYISGRVLKYNTEEDTPENSNQAVQDSMLSPGHWNISYDGILNLVMPEEAFLVG